jgi:hypothetical protein
MHSCDPRGARAVTKENRKNENNTEKLIKLIHKMKEPATYVTMLLVSMWEINRTIVLNPPSGSTEKHVST